MSCVVDLLLYGSHVVHMCGNHFIPARKHEYPGVDEQAQMEKSVHYLASWLSKVVSR